ncbi:unnamed protein product [Moneuplotes crassus]|uniref:Uncharacterized protein n=1 Tax=Euplotes crassus TaxID=5936 RepID=A0AAD1X838_EUPCR|nr:unnamed protein product [Moneuplotes crassus]
MNKWNNRKNRKKYITKKSTKREESNDDDQSSNVFHAFPINSIIYPENSQQESLCENLKQKLKRNIINTSQYAPHRAGKLCISSCGSLPDNL